MSPPSMYMTIQNYHYETRYRRVRDQDGNERSESYQVRVDTHRASQDFVGAWVDQSPPPSTLNYLDVMLLTRLRTYKTILWSPLTRMRYQREKSSFVHRHRSDVHYDYHFHEDIPHHQGHCLVYNEVKGSKPWYVKMSNLVVLDMLFIGWIQRWKLNANTYKVHYELKKYVYN